ncbi:MAG: hypothetical protein KDB23_13080 [Planctomycetales bacterium]|nr:hypothetical protein [Planctomycetales bacterium]
MFTKRLNSIRATKWILLLTVVLAMLSNRLVAAAAFSRIIVFGDSMSDSGNLYDLSNGFANTAPYYDGHASNGPVWIEHVAAALGFPALEASRSGGTNYAYAGAQAGAGFSAASKYSLVPDNADDYGIPNVAVQIDEFLGDDHTFTDDDLIALWVGHNDLGYWSKSPRTLIANLSDHISQLYEGGARNFLVGNVFSQFGDRFTLPGSSSLNALLADQVNTWRTDLSGVAIDTLDVAQLWTRVVANPQDFGFTELNIPAFNGETGEVAMNVDEYAWWDFVHPTASFHRVIAREALASLSKLTLGDFDDDGLLTSNDLDELTTAIGTDDRRFDLNLDTQVDDIDRVIWIDELKHTWLGDANLDGEFNSADLVHVFQLGQYEDDIADNSTWSTGDWDGDREFTTTDFVLAMQGGGYNAGPRQLAAAVPEPSGLSLLSLAVCWLLRLRLDKYSSAGTRFD